MQVRGCDSADHFQSVEACDPMTNMWRDIPLVLNPQSNYGMEVATHSLTNTHPLTEAVVWPVARLECLRCEKEELENSLLEQLKELRLQKQKELQVLQKMLKHEQQEETELLQKQQEEEEHNRSIKNMKMACEQETKSLEEELEKLRLSLQPIEEDIMSLKVALEMKNQEIKNQHNHLHVLVLLQQSAALIARKDLHVAKSRRLADEMSKLQEYLEKEDIEKKLLSQTMRSCSISLWKDTEEDREKMRRFWRWCTGRIEDEYTDTKDVEVVWPVARLECLRCEKEELENSLLEQLKELRLQKQKELQVLQEMLKHEQQEETELLQKQQVEEEHNRSIKTVMILALADMKMACEQEKKSLEEELEKLRLSLQPIEEDMSLKVALEMKNQEIKDQHDHLGDGAPATLSRYQRRLDLSPLERQASPVAAQFKNLDLTTKKLIHEGPLTWKVNKDKAIDIHALLLSDMLVLLQRGSGDRLILRCPARSLGGVWGRNTDLKTPFCPVVRLDSSLVRSVATDNKALYVISTSERQIYELVAGTSSEKNTWKNLLEKTISSASGGSEATKQGSTAIPTDQSEAYMHFWWAGLCGGTS
ncbi:hypothetical protein P4O66_022148 [Electrophorus voltai]|uniref:PH domain-containing protein n=1 Tax=Electrophorus voltai TaxID=2609070 RepID=A0AAD8ZP93_9TELE|nr:hypothetical protein P4O66_022148 [Electrophorus voltai]